MKNSSYLFAPGGKRLDAAKWGVADGYTASYSENNSVGQFAWPWTWKRTTPAGVRSPYLFGDYHAEFVMWEERYAMSDGEYERFYHNL